MGESQPDDVVIGPYRVARALLEIFGPLTDSDYLPGKTLFRDALCERFGFSQLEAEELCDELERGNLIEFVRSESGVGWHIRAPEASSPKGRVA